MNNDAGERSPLDAAPMCFACGPDNPIGLQIRFEIHDDGRCIGHFVPNEKHVGYADTVHGGILYAALDDVMANVMYLQQRKAHTARCEIRYREPLRVGEAITLTGWIENERRRLLALRGEARRDRDGKLIAECDASFMLV